ncbi:MAG: hypothetical protein JSU85_14155 [Candidatus Zixiibacteriota bacterium]|nr:MAG: hypothetical protein JSU85_14155 [candidate division Zixibacteria bacterium]
MPGPVCVKVYNYRHQAQRAVEILKSYGIGAMIQADDAGGMRPDLVMHTGGVKLMVIAEAADRALEILESFNDDQSG